jgi:glycosyltransferase involved in cell wall biosynthesis
VESLERNLHIMKSLSAANGQSLGGARVAESSGRRYRVMHLATWTFPHVGGVEMHMHELCKALADHMDVSEAGGGGPRFRSVHRVIDGIPITQLATPTTLRSSTICPSIPLAIRASKADLVHLHMPNPFGAAAFLVSGHRGPLIITWHFDVVRQRLMKKLFTPLFKKILNRASAVIATSPNIVRSSDMLQAFSDRVRVIPYGIDYEIYSRRHDSEVAAIRKQYGPKIVLGVGRLIYYKGFEYLVSAMSEVNAKLLIAGEGPLREELERQVQAEGTKDRVEFLGEKSPEQLIPYYQACDVFALSSVRGEAFGIVQLEAMASGKPVVNTMLNSGVPFASRDGESGFTVPPRDSKGLAAAINRLLEDEPLRLRYGREGKLRVQREFSVPAMTRAMLKLYGEALSDGTLEDRISVG